MAKPFEVSFYNVSRPSAARVFLKRLRKLVKAGKPFSLVKKGASYNEAETWGLIRKMADGSRAVLIQSSRFEGLVKLLRLQRPSLWSWRSAGF
jgi:hypothetical protein